MDVLGERIARGVGTRGLARVPIVSWVLLLSATCVGWAFVLADAGMNGPGAMGLNLGAFIGLWVAMMAGMMLPSIMPTASAYARGLNRIEDSTFRATRRVAALTAGYVASWTLCGFAFYGLASVGGGLANQESDWTRWLAAGIVLLCGVYQFTPVKHACLTRCRSTFAFVVRFASFRGPARDLRAGLYHGTFCLGCCLGLMLVLIPVGLMNLGWMAALACIITFEKTWRHGRVVARAVGVSLLIYAALIPAIPQLAPGLDASRAGAGGPMIGMSTTGSRLGMSTTGSRTGMSTAR